jgi:Deoxyribonuclease NucA/NucB
MGRIAAAVGALALLGGGGTAVVVTRDGDGGPSCRTSSQPVTVDLDNARHLHVLDHAWDAIGEGKARILHLDRPGARENRKQSLAGIKTKKGFDRDEYPPAVSAEGGTGADVRYVRSKENRSAGSVMGRQLADWCDQQAFVFEPRRG